MDGHACAEALRIPSLVELCVCHRDCGLVLTYSIKHIGEIIKSGGEDTLDSVVTALNSSV